MEEIDGIKEIIEYLKNMGWETEDNKDWFKQNGSYISEVYIDKEISFVSNVPYAAVVMTLKEMVYFYTLAALTLVDDLIGKIQCETVEEAIRMFHESKDN